MKIMTILLTLICTINGPYVPDYVPPPAKGANGPMQPK